MMRRFGISLCILIFLIAFCSAEDFGYNIEDGSINLVNPINYTTIQVNDTLHLEGRDTDALYLYFKGLFNDIYCELTGCEMTGDLFVNTTGNTTLWVQSELNYNSCFYLMESSTLGFSICNDGTGTNRLVISSMNGAGEVSEVFTFNRDNGDIELNGSIETTEDLDVAGNITGNQIYGGMNYHNYSGVNLNFASGDVYYYLFYTDAQHLNGFTANNIGLGLNSSLTTLVSGTYQLTYFAVGSGQNNHQYHVVPFIDDVEYDLCETMMKMSSGGDVNPMSGNCFIDLTAGDNVSLRIRDYGSTGMGIYYGSNINLVRVGD